MSEDIELLRLRARAKQKQEQEAAQEDKGVLDYAGDALQGGLSALDYAGGFGRTAAQQVGDLMTGEDNAQWSDAVRGDAQGMSDYMEKAGVLSDSPISRNIIGFVGDVALDPLTYLSGGLSAISKGKSAGKAAKALGALKLADNVGPAKGLMQAGATGAAAVEAAPRLTKLGKIINYAANPLEAAIAPFVSNKAYGKAFQKVDTRIANKFPGVNDEKTYAKLAQENNFSGNAGDFVDFMEQNTGRVGAEIGKTVDEVAKKGGTINAKTALGMMEDGSLREGSLLDKINKLKESFITRDEAGNILHADPEDLKLIESLQTKALSFAAKTAELAQKRGDLDPKMGIKLAQEWRQRLANTIYNTGALPATEKQQLLRSFERSLSDGVEQAVEGSLSPTALNKFKADKKLYRMGTEDPMKILRQWGGEVKEMRGVVDPSEVDFTLGGMALHSPGAAAGLAAKMIGRAGKSTTGLTFVGKKANQLQKTKGMGDSVLRTAIQEALNNRNGEEE